MTLAVTNKKQTEPAKFNIYKELALKSLRHGNYSRTNQFDVQRRLDGLEEKFSIYDKDDLAIALRQRLDELASRSIKWAPEIVCLLLELSEKPIQNSKLEDLNFMRPPEESSEPRLKWEDLVAEDPLLRDERVWQNIDYAVGSSDDEEIFLHRNLDCSSIVDTPAVSLVEDENLRCPEDLQVSVDSESLKILQKAQFWRHIEQSSVNRNGEEVSGGETLQITERQAIREILYMLSGLPTTLFEMDSSKSITRTNPAISLQHVSSRVFKQILSEFIKYGNSIGLLRIWTACKQSVSLLQRLQSEILLRLRQFDNRLSELQAIYVAPRGDTVVSLIQLQVKVASLAESLSKLSNIIEHLHTEPYAHAFRYLELLHHEVCASQMAGNEKLYEFMGVLFFNCFEVYLRPIRKWMEEGGLSKDENGFFISETAGDIEVEYLWGDRFRLLQAANGALHSPNFLQTSANKIFTTGKSVVVLKYLGRYDTVKRTHLTEPKLDFETVCSPQTQNFVPFPQLFDNAFEQWIQNKHHAASSTLRDALFNEYGLRSSLGAMEKIYFMADGATMSVLANAIFDKLDNIKITWNDRFILTELAQSTVGALEGIAAERLRASIAVNKYSNVQKSRKSVKCLSSIAFTYGLPWSVQIIITKESISNYQRMFSFLLQIRRAKYMMESIQLRDTANVNRYADRQALFYSLRSKLLWFSSVLYTYLTSVVIHTNTQQMRTELDGAEDIDCMIEIHRKYIKRVVDQAFLGSQLEPIHQSILAILDLSIELFDARRAHASLRSTPKVPMRLGRSAQRQRGVGWDKDAESEGDDSEGEADMDSATAGAVGLSYAGHVQKMSGEFDRLRKFVCTGIRSVMRAGGEPSWEMFADLVSTRDAS